jgi:hypothetical protein
MKLLNEGGNVFKDADGNPETQRINQTDVAMTVQWLERLTGLDLSQDRDPSTNYPVKWLGSTGKTPTSGDLDLAVDSTQIGKQQLKNKLDQWAASHGFDPKQWTKMTGEAVHFKTPITGRPDKGYVQTDFMFMPDLKWGIFWLSSRPGSAYKGMYRNVLMSSLAKPLGLKASNKGITDRTSGEVLTIDPNQAAVMLLGKSASVDDLSTVESIYQALAKDPKRDIKLADFREYLKQAGLTEPDTVQESDINFLARLRDRIVNQGMQPLVESSIQTLTEAKDPRIPHLEDRVFQRGVAGIDEVLAILKDTAEKTAQYASPKWDGKPAIIFGRKPSGEFVLTDKSGLNAVGYDGQATSVDMISDIMRRRDAGSAAKGKPADRSNLIAMYQDIWPYFEAATPKDFQGFVKGDLIYFPQNPYREEAGNFVFTPNTIEYRIPIQSSLGQRIAGTKVGIALHTKLADANAPEQPIDFNIDKTFKKVNGLMMAGSKVETLEPVRLNQKLIAQLKSLKSQHGVAISQLLNPTELRAMKITDLPALMESFINSLVGTDFKNATPAQFGQWLQANVTPNKFQNIIEYLNSPKSNITGMAAAFTVWNLMHQIKMDLLQKLDLQEPGHEGWVLATPAGRVKAVNRTAGGFTAANRAKNQ